MVTAKKTNTPKPSTVVERAPEKPVAAKMPAAKKAVSPAVPAAAAALAPAPAKAEATAKPEAKAKPNASIAQPKAAAAAKTNAVLSTEQRNHYVEVTAFYIAERRGFVPGNPADDWCAAEREVDRLIATGYFNT